MAPYDVIGLVIIGSINGLLPEWIQNICIHDYAFEIVVYKISDILVGR